MTQNILELIEEGQKWKKHNHVVPSYVADTDIYTGLVKQIGFVTREQLKVTLDGMVGLGTITQHNGLNHTFYSTQNPLQ